MVMVVVVLMVVEVIVVMVVVVVMAVAMVVVGVMLFPKVLAGKERKCKSVYVLGICVFLCLIIAFNTTKSITVKVKFNIDSYHDFLISSSDSVRLLETIPALPSNKLKIPKPN